MSTEKFRLEEEEALIENEITEYKKLIQKLREKPKKEELSEESKSFKPECLSNLVILSTNSTKSTAKYDLRNLADRIIKTYR